MGKTSTSVYKGGLRTENTHLRSGSTILTDAPVDNRGQGQAFSPTDLCATSLANCMLTVMGIKAEDHGWDLKGATATVEKEMASDPRRIAAIRIFIRASRPDDSKAIPILERTAKDCPVAKSLHPDLVQEVSFEWE